VNTRYATRLADQNKSTAYRFSQSKKTTDYDLYDKHAKQLLLQAFQLLWPDLCGSATRMHAAKSPTHSSNPHVPTHMRFSVFVTIQNELGKIRQNRVATGSSTYIKSHLCRDEIRCHPTCNLNRSDNARFPPALSPETTTS
jgi:hypothetical protein